LTLLARTILRPSSDFWFIGVTGEIYGNLTIPGHNMLVDLALSRVSLQAKGAEVWNPLAKPGCSNDASHSPLAAFPLDERFAKVQSG
jgi:hypothetical protein